jgi:cytidine deaminase
MTTESQDVTAESQGVPEIDWELLRREAVAVMERAYVPYSKFRVGAAAVVSDGRLVTGCNVENASYGLGLCAECGLVSALAASGGGLLVAMVCVDGEGALLMPCGRCRQLLFEHGGPQMLVAAEGGPITVADLLPEAFGPHDLAAMAAKAASDAPPT